MVTLISHNPDETIALGETWGHAAQPGWIIGLTGELGAGKTQLVKGVARGLGSTARVHSPTFNLVNQYTDGRLPLFHLDLYRLQSPEQITNAGLEEFLWSPPGVTVVEWIDRWIIVPLPSTAAASLNLPSPLRYVRLETISETERKILYEDVGR